MPWCRWPESRSPGFEDVVEQAKTQVAVSASMRVDGTAVGVTGREEGRPNVVGRVKGLGACWGWRGSPAAFAQQDATGLIVVGPAACLGCRLHGRQHTLWDGGASDEAHARPPG